MNVIDLLSYNIAIVGTVKGGFGGMASNWQAVVKAGGDYVRGGIYSPWAAGNLRPEQSTSLDGANMAEITAAMVKALREKTDAPMMECKKALTEANGDMNRAEEVLRVKLGSKASKAAARVHHIIQPQHRQRCFVQIRVQSARPAPAGRG